MKNVFMYWNGSAFVNFGAHTVVRKRIDGYSISIAPPGHLASMHGWGFEPPHGGRPKTARDRRQWMRAMIIGAGVDVPSYFRAGYMGRWTVELREALLCACENLNIH